jgi:hypothetical protein
VSRGFKNLDARNASKGKQQWERAKRINGSKMELTYKYKYTQGLSYLGVSFFTSLLAVVCKKRVKTNKQKMLAVEK